MTSLSRALVPLRAIPQRPAIGSIPRLLQFVLHSRALASMLPSLLLSGMMTLVVSAMMRLMLAGSDVGFLHAWMESWLITWSIGFPLAYMAQISMARLLDEQNDSGDTGAAQHRFPALRAWEQRA